MKIVFMGTTPFSVTILDALCRSGFQPELVVTRPDSRQNRGRKTLPSPVKARALELGLPLFQPSRWDRQAVDSLRAWAPRLVVTAAYGLLLPRAVLDIPPLGCINVHPSLLPRYRGAAPIQRCLMAGDEVTGVSIYLMDAGMDTGPLLMQQQLAVSPEDNTASLSAKLAALSSEMIAAVIPGWAAGELTPVPQQGEPVLAPPIRREEELLDWSLPAPLLANRIRGLSPAPGAYTFFRGKRLKVLQGRPCPGTGLPGQVTGIHPLTVAAGEGTLELITVQPEGKRPMAAEDFLRGYRLVPGECLGGEQ